VAQKPREGTYAENVLKFGTGGLNIDACRIEAKDDLAKNWDRKSPCGFRDCENTLYGKGELKEDIDKYKPKGRYPANIVLDPQAAKMLDRQSGVSKSKRNDRGDVKDNDIYGDYNLNSTVRGHNDKGGASRFFYSSKAHKSERNAGLDKLEEKNVSYMGHENDEDDDVTERYQTKAKNDIATLKPINLMRWLVRLVTPPNGIVLDPFGGSGTTGCAAEIEGFDYILIEKRERFAELIAPKRCQFWSKPENWTELKDHNEVPDLEHKQKKQMNITLENFGG